MEVKKSFTEASTSGSQDKLPETRAPTEIDPSILTMFLETCMKLLRNFKVVKGLYELISKCAGKENSLDGHYVVRKIGKHKVRIGRKMRLSTQIGDYEMDWVILDLGSNANIFPI